eukprot:5963005-Alexandrium_andersonii.AAC.1
MAAVQHDEEGHGQRARPLDSSGEGSGGRWRMQGGRRADNSNTGQHSATQSSAAKQKRAEQSGTDRSAAQHSIT